MSLTVYSGFNETTEKPQYIFSCDVKGLQPVRDDMVRWSGVAECQGQPGFLCVVDNPSEQTLTASCQVVNYFNDNMTLTSGTIHVETSS